MRKHQSDGALVREACQLYKTFTLDDDPRVPFGKAHDHAKMIVMEAEALELLLDIAKSKFAGNKFLDVLLAMLDRV